MGQFLSDADFWREVWHQWRNHLTGAFSAKFLLAAYVITLLVIFLRFPDRNGAIASAALTGVLIVGSALNAIFKTWEKEHANVLALKQELQQFTEPSSIERISLIALLREAQELGIDFTGDSHAVLKLCEKLRQEASDGVLQIWGRARNHSDPFLPIPKEHWYEFEIDWTLAFNFSPPHGEITHLLVNEHNFYVQSRKKIDPNRTAYWDLSFTKAKTIAWLRQYCQSS